ncbi:nucleoside deaminase [Virgibacillus halophilus]|uniref:Nucleoside deaminase n=1 Tax=Tigheibacillus halophilus TaxID=361280 RepID=A0ABU5C7T3_9BACI|nr:nucleoside deaminase [Virgibacillus halophilus]
MGKYWLRGVNELHHKYDVSAHAEMNAIREAQEKLQTRDLSGSVMYCSGEPCSMCLTAMFFVGIEKGYYASSIEETAGVGLTDSAMLYEDLKKPREERQVRLVHIALDDDAENPMEQWRQNQKS